MDQFLSSHIKWQYGHYNHCLELTESWPRAAKLLMGGDIQLGMSESGRGQRDRLARTHSRHLWHRCVEKPVREHRPVVIHIMDFDGEAGRRFQVPLGVLVHYKGNEVVLGDLLPVQPLEGVHVPRVLIDPEDLVRILSFEYVLGILAVHTRFNLRKKRRCEPRMGIGRPCACMSVRTHVSVQVHVYRYVCVPTCVFVHVCLYVCVVLARTVTL